MKQSITQLMDKWADWLSYFSIMENWEKKKSPRNLQWWILVCKMENCSVKNTKRLKNKAWNSLVSNTMRFRLCQKWTEHDRIEVFLTLTNPFWQADCLCWSLTWQNICLSVLLCALHVVRLSVLLWTLMYRLTKLSKIPSSQVGLHGALIHLRCECPKPPKWSHQDDFICTDNVNYETVPFLALCALLRE